jgi:hypothetical protein
MKGDAEQRVALIVSLEECCHDKKEKVIRAEVRRGKCAILKADRPDAGP